MQVLSTDCAKAISMLQRMAAEPTADGTPKAGKTALIPLNFLRRCKVAQQRLPYYLACEWAHNQGCT